MITEVNANVMREVMTRTSKFLKMRAQIRRRPYLLKPNVLDPSSKDKI